MALATDCKGTLMQRICSVKPLKDFLVEIELTNGKTKTVDLEPYLHGPVFTEIKSNRKKFLAMRVDQRFGTIVWDNGADIDPDVLIDGLTPAWKEEPFSASYGLQASVNEPGKGHKTKKNIKQKGATK